MKSTVPLPPDVIRCVWLFRHGLRADWLTDFDPAMVHAKDNDIAPAGVEQFEYCAAYLENQPVDHLISSPYRRCVHSAEIIACRINKPILLEPGIHETHGGAAPAVLSPQELATHYPHVKPDHPPLFAFASNEDEAAWRERGARVIHRLLETLPGNLCLVSHGNPLVAMQQALVPGFVTQGMRCASFSRFDLTPSGWVSGIAYSIDHLGPVNASTMRHIDWDPAQELQRLAPVGQIYDALPSKMPSGKAATVITEA